MGQPRGHRCQPDLSHPPSPPCQHAIHHDSLSSSPHRSKPSSSHLHTPDVKISTTRGGSRPLALPSATTARTRSAAMQSHEGSSSETTGENFLYCYQGGLRRCAGGAMRVWMRRQSRCGQLVYLPAAASGTASVGPSRENLFTMRAAVE